jgi:hypothetical protein
MDEFLRINFKNLIAHNESLVSEIKGVQGRIAELATRRLVTEALSSNQSCKPSLNLVNQVDESPVRMKQAREPKEVWILVLSQATQRGDFSQAIKGVYLTLQAAMEENPGDWQEVVEGDIFVNEFSLHHTLERYEVKPFLGNQRLKSDLLSIETRRQPKEASIKAAQNHTQSVLKIGEQVKRLGRLLRERGHVNEELGGAIESSGEAIQAQVQESQRLAPSVNEEMSLDTLVLLNQAHVIANQEYVKALKLYLEASKRMAEKLRSARYDNLSIVNQDNV